MNKSKRIVVLLMAILLSGLLVACGPSPTPDPTPTATPGPTPTPPAHLPASYHATDFGVDNPSFYDELRLQERSLEQYSTDVGASWNRWDFRWAWVRREKDGVLDWYWEDNSYFEGAYSYDEATSFSLSNPSLRLIGILNGGIPATAGETPYEQGGGWETFITQVVSRYEDRINVWEVGNEEFIYEALTPEQYVAALDRACEVIRRTQGATATLLLGSPIVEVGLSVANRAYGFSGGSDYPGTERYEEILRHISNEEARKACIDAIGIHAYNRPAWTWWIVLGIGQYLEGLNWKDNQPEYWITESGVQHNDNGACISDRGLCVSDFQQASYVIQQYIMAKQAFAEANPAAPNGVVIHHRIRDHFSDGTFGLLTEDANFRLPSYYAAWLITQILGDATYGFNSITDLSGPGYKHLVLTSREERPIHILWTTKPQDVAISLSLLKFQNAQLYYQSQAQNYYAGEAEPQLVKSGGQLILPGTTSESGGDGNDPYKGADGNKNWDSNYYIGGEVYILVETNEPCATASTPTGGAAVVCANGRAVGADLWAYDADSGLQSLTVACSPEVTYDLSWTQPGVHYAGTVRTAPAPAAVCTLTLTDRDGLTLQQTLRNDCRNDGSGGSTPGDDHPDDNFSAAGIPAGASGVLDGNFFVLPEGARAAPRVAILNNGFAHNLWWLLAQLGEPADYIGTDFDPVAVAQTYPVLLIPSGGLYGLENDAVFRARLEEYARQGGTIVAFAQQHGYEYAALPGGEVNGYGWNEDISCFQAALRMESWHPLLAGFNRDTLTVHVIVTLFIPSTCPTCVAA